MSSWSLDVKPTDVHWTDAQWQAISLKGGNILVAAAAGSGKTAVLVERIVRRIMDPEDSAEIDRLLIVTFTKAAAAEMKERIGERIEEELQTNPSLYLQRQRQLLNRANISTLHSFCQELIRNYYYDIDVDPKVRIANDTERELLKEEVLEEVLERYYSKSVEDAEAFFELVEAYSNDRSDDGFRSLVFELYTRSRAHPEPNVWLDSLVTMYNDTYSHPEETIWGAHLLRAIKEKVHAAKNALTKALELALEHNYDYFQSKLQAVQTMDDYERWNDIRDAVEQFTWGRMPAKPRNQDIDESTLERAKAYRDQSKKLLEDVAELLKPDPASYLDVIETMKPRVAQLVEIVKTFSEQYRVMKREKTLIDFDDLEHFALEILSGESIREPSAAALFYQDHFEEVLTDEYQDTNQVQEAILELLSNGQNRFMVGDVKQSIYRFRLAEPALFIHKHETYASIDNLDLENPSAGAVKIDLSSNFRSRRTVLDGVNYLFEQTMDKEVGDVTYDESQSLQYGNIHYDDQASDYDPEVFVVEAPSDAHGEESLTKVEQEAQLVANKIQRLVHEAYPVFDKQTKATRPVEYRDFAILMRSLPSAPTYLDVFKRAGIPVYSDRDEGYFRRVEVQVMLSLLRVIDNPYQDIPLASVLRSPIVGLREHELAEIRLQAVGQPFYEAVKAMIATLPALDASTESSFLVEKAHHEDWKRRLHLFYVHLQSWRVRARHTSLATFIWELFEETGYDAYVGGLSGGKQRQANVQALYDKAKTFEKTSFRGIFRFLRFVDRMEEQGDDLESARTLSEKEDVVTILSIHKSKGLEFPVVFVVDMMKNFNLSDSRRSIQIHQSLGFGSSYFDTKRRIKRKTLPELAIKEAQKREQMSEELRILYVALTRAKEKLFLIGSAKGVENSLASYKLYAESDQALLPTHVRSNAKHFYDFIIPALLRHPQMENEHPDYVAFSRYPHDATFTLNVIEEQKREHEQLEAEAIEETLQQMKQLKPVGEKSEYYDFISERLRFDYPYKEATDSFAKQSVSELKQSLQEADPYSQNTMTDKSFTMSNARRPKFMQQQKLSGAEIGTATHTVMQHVSFTETNEDEIRSLTNILKEKELLTEQETEVVNAKAVLKFIQSDLGIRIQQATEIHREIAFSYIRKTEEDNAVLVQGMADLVFVDHAGNNILIDYKTDQIASRFTRGFDEAEPVMRKRYEQQLRLYKEALEQIWNEEITESWLYFFDGGHALKL